MRSLTIPLGSLFLALAPACDTKHSLGNLGDTDGTTSGAPTDPPDPSGTTTGAPTSSSDPTDPSETTSNPPSGTTNSEEDPCYQYPDQASCEAAAEDCQYIAGSSVIAEADGCRWGDPIGFCVGPTGGNQTPGLTCAPDGTPVVFPFDVLNPPPGWGNCSCEEQGLAIDCFNAGMELAGSTCGELTNHCAVQLDEASCNQFQGDPGLGGCLWVEARHEIAAEPMCGAEPPVDHCIPVFLSADDGCGGGPPPEGCNEDARPHYMRVDEDLPVSKELILIKDIPCTMRPLDEMWPCWDEEGSPAKCECACEL